MSRSIGTKEPKSKQIEVVLEVTQTEYDDMLAQGVDGDEPLKPGKHLFKRVTDKQIALPEDLDPANTKVQITMKVDLDVLNHFKDRAARSNAAPYQTQINAELRKVMENDLADERSEINDVAKRLLNDAEFVAALSEKLKK